MTQGNLAPENGPSAPTSVSLRRALGLPTLAIYGVGNMLGAGIYGLVGKAAGQMGHMLWLAFVVSLLAAGLTGLSYASLGSRYPKAAGAAFVTQRAWAKPWLTYLIGLAIMASGLTSMATASRVFADYSLTFLGSSLPPAVVVGGFLLLLALVNFRGIRESAGLNNVCTVVETAGLLLIIAVGLPYLGSVNYLDPTSVANPAGNLDLALLLQTSILTFFAFIGFEDLLNVSEEVKNPRRTFPLAMVIALSLVTVIYILVSLAAVSVVPRAELTSSPSPLLEVVHHAAPWCPSWVFAAVALFAVANTALLNFIMGSRLAYGMARQGLLPAFLGTIHPQRQTPHRAIGILLLIALALALPGNVKTLASATSLLLMLAFIVVNGSLWRLQRQPQEPRGGFEVPAFVPLGGVLICGGLILNNAVASLKNTHQAWSDSQSWLQALSPLTPFLIAGGLLAGILVLYAIQKPRVVEESVAD
ncbi:MAG: amino acid permease [Phycisphaeraceae bacterium]|nr:amino acid permease [Phycisphaeraceae bacterium]